MEHGFASACEKNTAHILNSTYRHLKAKHGAAQPRDTCKAESRQKKTAPMNEPQRACNGELHVVALRQGVAALPPRLEPTTVGAPGRDTYSDILLVKHGSTRAQTNT